MEQEKMKQNNRAIGTQKEQVAKYFLEKAGYEIVQMNYRCKCGEIDIIARKDGYLIFVEVKYRSNLQKGEPALAVNYRKRRKICQTARYYLCEKHYREDYPCRFDVVEIIGNRIRVLDNAFDYLL